MGDADLEEGVSVDTDEAIPWSGDNAAGGRMPEGICFVMVDCMMGRDDDGGGGGGGGGESGRNSIEMDSIPIFLSSPSSSPPLSFSSPFSFKIIGFALPFSSITSPIFTTFSEEILPSSGMGESVGCGTRGLENNEISPNNAFSQSS